MNNKKIIKRLSKVLGIIVLVLTVLTGFSQTYNFTNAGVAGIAGPSQIQVNTAYTGTNLSGKVTIVGSGIQEWVVPATGTYSITTAGASGGYTPHAPGGKGRIITTQLNLTAGSIINILVGQVGGRAEFASPGYSGGGGGGTFIINKTTGVPILISGGGGGAGEGNTQWGTPILPGVNASEYNVANGGDGVAYVNSWAPFGIGGTNENGGQIGIRGGGSYVNNSGGSGGGGYNGNGVQGGYGGSPGISYNNGGSGGINRNYSGGFTLDIAGGFGGGAGAGTHSSYEANGGGGGGYSGGGGSATRAGAGGGGGNLYTGTYISSDLNTGNGYATIKSLYTPAGALQFNGNNNYVTLPGSVGNVGAGDFTIQMDVIIMGGNGYLLSKREACNNPSTLFSLNYNMDGTIAVEMFGKDPNGNGGYHAISSNLPVDGAWHHLAFTRKDKILSLYFDGIFKTSGFLDGYINNSGLITTLGFGTCVGQNGSTFFKGSMDEVRIWNRALCAEEINSNMSCELPAGQTGLLNYYKFNQGNVNQDNTAINTLTDYAGSANGTLNNFNLTGTSSNWVAGNIGGICSSFVPRAVAITGTATLCVASTTTLANANTGTWSSSNTAIATISATGVVTGISGGTCSITFTTDCGGVSTATLTVNGLPTVITKNKSIVLDANGNGSIVSGDIDNGSTSNCGIASYYLNKQSFNYSNIGSNTVTLTVTDNSGNSASGTAIVTVLANGLNAYGQLVTDRNVQTNQYGAKGAGASRTQYGQILGSSLTNFIVAPLAGTEVSPTPVSASPAPVNASSTPVSASPIPVRPGHSNPVAQ